MRNAGKNTSQKITYTVHVNTVRRSSDKGPGEREEQIKFILTKRSST